jgi:hypothetical protein
MNRETAPLILTEELEMSNSCAKIVPRKLTEQQRGARFSAVFDDQIHCGDAAASLITWSRTLIFVFNSKFWNGIEKTSFWVNRRHPEVCDAGLKRHPIKCLPIMPHTMAAPLENVCAGTRDVLWRWPPVVDEWINNFFFLESVSLLYCRPRVFRVSWTVTKTVRHAFKTIRQTRLKK